MEETTPSTIAEALERATRLHTEALRQIEELLRDEDVVPVDEEESLEAAFAGL